MKREFASLTAQEALHVAIFIEERNAEIYRELAEMFAEFRDPASLEIAAAFWEMSNDERGHGTQLQKRYLERFGTQACAVTEDYISDFIEVPRLSNGEIFAISKVKVGRSPREMALEVAIAAEDSAIRFYRRLVEATQDENLVDQYRELLAFETNHSGWLDQKLSETRRFNSGSKLA